MRLRMLVLLALTAVQPARALDVFACEPEWGSLVQELAGPQATVYVATSAGQDPHYIEARPSLIAEIRRAQLLVCTGADLEVGWLPLLLRRSGNPAIQPGQPGHFLAASQVRRLEVPSTVDRGQGDIHPQGNPHVHLDPHNILRIADALADVLARVDPANAILYANRHRDFEQRWRAAMDRWRPLADRLGGLVVITHHRSFSYLAQWLDLQVLANIEPKPGIPPSSAHLARLLEQFQGAPPAAILRTPYTDGRPSAWLSERLGAPALVLPYTVGGADTANLFELYEVTLDRLLDLER